VGLREEKKARTRRAILEAAEARFRAEGFDATRVRDIADLLHLSEQTVFNYFPTKQALLDALAVQWFRDLAERAGSSEPPTRVEEFMSGIRVLLRAIAGDREYMRLVFTGAPMLRGAGTPGFEENFAVLRRIFAAQQEAGELRDDLSPQEIAEYYVTLFNATVTRWLRDPDAPPEALEQRVERALGVLFRGLRPVSGDRE
jgi:AcrR family transcriptional regulator